MITMKGYSYLDNSQNKQKRLYLQVDDYASVLPLEAMDPVEAAYKIVEDLDGAAGETEEQIQHSYMPNL